MKKAVRAELNRIEDFLLVGGEEARELWDIITALRGPDERENKGIKGTTTCVVRRRAFPRLTVHSAHHNLRATFKIYYGPNPYLPHVVKEDPFHGVTHFGRHIARAKQALVAKDPKPVKVTKKR